MSPQFAIALVAIAAGAACSLAGIFLVVRRLSMVSDAISHAILPGLVAGYWLANGPNLLIGGIGALAAGLLTVIFVETLSKSKLVKEDSAIGLVFPVMFAIGVVLISKYFSNVHLDADAVLFGEIAFAPFETVKLAGLDLGPQSFWVLAGLCLVNGLFVAIFFKELKVGAFDPALAKTLGYKPSLLHYASMSLVALTTVGALSAVGAVLSVALIIAPTAIALLFARQLHRVVFVAVLVGVGASLIGYGAASVLDVSISGMIAVVLGFLFVAALLFAPQVGMVSQARRRQGQQREFSVDMLLMHLRTHEGTAQQAEESRFLHLEEELGWRPELAEQIVQWAVTAGLVSSADSRLHLTVEGRERADQVRSYVFR